MQRRLLLARLGVHLRAVAQQDADDVGLVGARGQVQSRLTAHGGRVRVGAVLDQVDDDVHVAHEGRHM